jgi:hypothetical protein
MGKYQQKNVWLFVHVLNIASWPVFEFQNLQNFVHGDISGSIPHYLMKAILSYAIPLLSIAISLSLHRDAMVCDFPNLANEGQACENADFHKLSNASEESRGLISAWSWVQISPSALRKKTANCGFLSYFWRKACFFCRIFSAHLRKGDFLSSNFRLKPYSWYYKRIGELSFLCWEQSFSYNPFFAHSQDYDDYHNLDCLVLLFSCSSIIFRKWLLLKS